MGFKMGFDDILCTKNRISCKSLRSKCLRGYAWSDFQGSDWYPDLLGLVLIGSLIHILYH